MMGQQPPAQNEFFYDFNLEKHIPPNHLLRRIDQFLDFDVIREHLHDFYSHTGRAISKTEDFVESLKERKKVEMAFAHMKSHLNFSRLRLRGIKGARDEFLLVATAQNLRKLAHHCAQPPPNLQGTCA